MALLDIKNVDVSYGKAVTVKDCSIALEQGQICSIVGESGSGKTTVIRAVLGLLPGGGKVTAGDIVYEGKSLLPLSPRAWRALRTRLLLLPFFRSNPYQAIMAWTRSFISSVSLNLGGFIQKLPLPLPLTDAVCPGVLVRVTT